MSALRMKLKDRAKYAFNYEMDDKAQSLTYTQEAALLVVLTQQYGFNDQDYVNQKQAPFTVSKYVRRTSVPKGTSVKPKSMLLSIVAWCTRLADPLKRMLTRRRAIKAFIRDENL